MATYYETARSNWFRVASLEAFEDALRYFGGINLQKRDDGTVALFFDEQGVPSARVPDDRDPDEPDAWDDLEWVDFSDWLAPYLAPGSVAIVTASGAEAMRYVSGYAFAVNATGEQRWVSIEDIYPLAAELLEDGDDELTRAEY